MALPKIVYIYYLCAEDGTPFYVGQTCDTLRRRAKHRRYYKNKNIQVYIIDYCTEPKAKWLESLWINIFKGLGYELTNKQLLRDPGYWKEEIESDTRFLPLNVKLLVEKNRITPPENKKYFRKNNPKKGFLTQLLQNNYIKNQPVNTLKCL